MKRLVYLFLVLATLVANFAFFSVNTVQAAKPNNCVDNVCFEKLTAKDWRAGAYSAWEQGSSAMINRTGNWTWWDVLVTPDDTCYTVDELTDSIVFYSGPNFKWDVGTIDPNDVMHKQKFCLRYK